MRITDGTGCTREEIAALWQECFGDSEEYIRFFLDTAYRPQDLLAAREEDGLAAMLFLLPCRLAGQPGRYVFAVATRAKSRRQGFSTLLLEQAKRLGRERGERFLCLVPAGQELFDFYARRGFFTAFDTVEGPVEELSAEGEDVSLAPAQLLGLRDGFFARCGYYLRWGEREFFWHLRETRFTGGRVIALRLAGDTGYALAVPAGEGWFLKEVVYPGEMSRFLAAVHGRLPGRLTARLWPGAGQQGNRRGFGMLCPLGELYPAGEAENYIGLVLD